MNKKDSKQKERNEVEPAINTGQDRTKSGKIISCSGRPLNADVKIEMKKQEESTENLKIALGKLLGLLARFSEMTGESASYEDEGNIINYKKNADWKLLDPEQIFKNQIEELKSTDSSFDIKVATKCEIDFIQGTLKEVEDLSNQVFISNHPIRIHALKYVNYLDQIINGSITQENKKVYTTFNTELSEEQMKKLRLRLMEGGFISRVSEKDFIYIFSGQPIKKNCAKIEWSRSINALRDLLERIQVSPVSAKKVKSCFTKNGTPIVLTKPGRGKVDSSGQVYFSSDITKIENILGNL